MITTLTQLGNGEQAVIHTIKGGNILQMRLSRLGVHTGDKITVIRSGYPGGHILIAVHGVALGIGRGMAEKIQVEIPS